MGERVTVTNSGPHGRSIYVSMSDPTIINMGCFNGTQKEAIAAIESNYRGSTCTDYIKNVNKCFDLANAAYQSTLGGKARFNPFNRLSLSFSAGLKRRTKLIHDITLTISIIGLIITAIVVSTDSTVTFNSIIELNALTKIGWYMSLYSILVLSGRLTTYLYRNVTLSVRDK